MWFIGTTGLPDEHRRPRCTGACASTALASIRDWSKVAGQTRQIDERVSPVPTARGALRVYNVWLGGKDHFLADRKAAQEIARAYFSHEVVLKKLLGDCGL